MPSMRPDRASVSTSAIACSRPIPVDRRRNDMAPPVAIIVFDGMQSHRWAAPPTTSRSTIVTWAPRRAAYVAAVLPAGPPPMITKRVARQVRGHLMMRPAKAWCGRRRRWTPTVPNRVLAPARSGPPSTSSGWATTRTLWLEPVRRGRRHVALRYGVDDIAFATTYWYDDVDFDDLEPRFGDGVLRVSSSTCWRSRPTRRPAWHRRRSTRARTATS